MPRLELSPISPFHDLEGFKARVRAAHPTITERGLNELIQFASGGYDPRTRRPATNGYNPRHPGRIAHLYGADIMTADLTTIPAWEWIGDDEKRRLQEHPIVGGAVIPNDVEGPVRRMLQDELAGRLIRREVNRSVLISPPGLKQTYVWRLSNGWVQEVLLADYDLILSSPGNRKLFRDPDIHGPYVDVRSFDRQDIVTSRTEATTVRDVEYLMGQTRRQPTWQGADLPKQ